MDIIIEEVGLDTFREPFIKPFGFKGGYFREKWFSKATLTAASGVSATGLGGIAVLWSDPAVFSAHTEVGGNLVMASMSEFALQQAKGATFETPLDLLDRVFGPTHEYGRRVTGNPNLRKTFTLNSLIALDNAAWVLYARANGFETFDAMVPDEFRPVLSHRAETVACAPVIGYQLALGDIVEVVRQGFFVLKIKIGAPGDGEEMLSRDVARIEEIHRAVGGMAAPHTDDGRVKYYLDANGRYETLDQVRRLLDAAERCGMRERIVAIEEPFAEDNDLDLSGVDAPFDADESLHDPADVRRKIDRGYRFLALKPAGKTLSMSLRMAAEARRQGAGCFVADSCCPPLLVEWNKNVAARLDPFPGLGMGMLESNGRQNYRNWDAMMAWHPCAGADWVEPRDGVFRLSEDYYRRGGGILLDVL